MKNTIIFAVGMAVTITLIIVATVYKRNHNLITNESPKTRHIGGK